MIAYVFSTLESAHTYHLFSFYDMARKAVETSSQSENKVTLALIKEKMGNLMYELSSMKFQVRPVFALPFSHDQNPTEKSEAEIKAHFDDLYQRMSDSFRSLEE